MLTSAPLTRAEVESALDQAGLGERWRELVEMIGQMPLTAADSEVKALIERTMTQADFSASALRRIDKALPGRARHQQAAWLVGGLTFALMVLFYNLFSHRGSATNNDGLTLGFWTMLLGPPVLWWPVKKLIGYDRQVIDDLLDGMERVLVQLKIEVAKKRGAAIGDVVKSRLPRS